MLGIYMGDDGTEDWLPEKWQEGDRHLDTDEKLSPTIVYKPR